MQSTRRRPLGFPAGVTSTVTGASGSSGRSTGHDFGMSPARTVAMLPFLALVGAFVVMPLLYHGTAVPRKRPPMPAHASSSEDISRLMSGSAHLPKIDRT